MYQEKADSFGTESPWGLYDQMIEGVPEDILVEDFMMGVHWSYVRSEAGAGVSFTVRGGGKRADRESLSVRSLKEMARLAKSWNFSEATIGVAALNAWYNNKERILAAGLKAVFEEENTVGFGAHRGKTGEKLDAFDQYKPEIETLDNPSVVVVGHFPHVENIAEYSRLTVLERNCSDALDTPDPACEYILPNADFAFITGVTLINKTAPRLLELSRNARTVMVGPSVVMCRPLMERGVETLSGSIVIDPEEVEHTVKRGVGKPFGKSLQMCTIGC